MENNENNKNPEIDLQMEKFNKKFSELTSISKSNQLDYFFNGNYCDLLDTSTKQWRTGIVVDRDDDEVKIKFLNSMTNKTEYEFNVTNSIDKTIGHFRKYTFEENLGFNTGFVKLKDNSITKSKIIELNAYLNSLNKMEDYTNEILDNFFESPLEIIQVLRGKIYFIFDNIINNNFIFDYEDPKKIKQRANKNDRKYNKKKSNNNNEEEEEDDEDPEGNILVTEVGDIINDFLNFSVKYLNWIRKNSYIGKLLSLNFNFMFHDKECAFFSSLYEITTILSNLFKENKFFQIYREIISNQLKDWGLEKIDYKISTTLYNITKNKGIDKTIIDILNDNTQSLFTFEQIAKILEINGIVLMEKRTEIYDFYYNRVDNLSVNELKFISFEDIENYVDKIRKLISMVVVDDKENKNVDKIHLLFVFKLISSNNLPMKIKGISVLNKIIINQSIENESLILFIQKVHLISKIILGADIHEEILKRSYEILKFVLISKGTKNEKMIQTLFFELQNDNKSIAEEVKNLLIFISNFYNPEIQIFYFNEVINKIDIQKFNYDLIDIIEYSTINTKNENGLNILWKIINLNQNEEIVDKSIVSFTNVFQKKIFNIEIINNYLNLCFDKIKNEDNLACMLLFKNIIEIYNKEIYNKLNEINQNNNLIELLLNLAENYVNNPNKEKSSVYKKQGKIVMTRLTVIYFIYNLLYNNDIELFKSIFNKIWEIFILNNNSDENDRDYFGYFIYNILYKNLNDEIKIFMYNDIFLNEKLNPPEQIQFSLFCVMNSFFYDVNYIYKNFIKIGNSKRFGKYDNLIGMEIFWNILKFSIFDKCLNLASEQLNLIILNPISISEKEIYDNLFMKYYENIYFLIKKNNSNKNVTINNIVYYLLKLNDAIINDNKYIYYDKKLLEKNKNNNNNNNNVEFYLNFTLTTQNLTKKIPIDIQNDTIYNIRQKVSQIFKIPLKLVQIKLKSEMLPILYENDSTLISKYCSKTEGSLDFEVSEIANKYYLLENNPKKLILENENIFNELFFLLSSYNKYHKTDDLNYFNINLLINIFPVSKKILDLINDFKFWEILKNDSSIYSQNYILRIIKSKILIDSWLNKLKNDTKIKRLFMNILLQFDIDKNNKNNINEIEFSCLENLLFIIDKSCDVKNHLNYNEIMTKIFDLLEMCFGNTYEKINSEGVINSIIIFFNNNFKDELNDIIQKNKNNSIKKICTDHLINILVNKKNKFKIFEFFIQNNFEYLTYLSMLNYMLDLELFENIQKIKNLIDESLFDFIERIIDKIHLNYEICNKYKKNILFNLNDIIEFIINILEKIIQENQNKNKNKNENESEIFNENIIFGYLLLFKALIICNINSLNLINKKNNFFDNFLHNFIFESDLIHNGYIRKTSLEILIIFCINNEKNKRNLIDTLNKYNHLDFWRSNMLIDWDLKSNKAKNKLNLTGLKNLGCTCYMNSLIQQFFMNKKLRENLINPEKNQKINELFHNLQYLLSEMKFTSKNFLEPKTFFNSITDYENNQLKAFNQMDVDEFFNLLTDKCESNIFNKYYEGKLTSSYTCDECKNESLSTQSFLTIDLQIKGKKDIKESLNTFFSNETLDGDNKYQCEKCKKKVKAIKNTFISEFPINLLLVLKRFEFDYETYIKKKIYDYYEFSEQIEIQKNKYNLKGIIIHQGNADYGHYFSVIKHNNKWIEFNDENIKEIYWRDIQLNAFGDYTGYKEKNSCAYLLFYEKEGEENYEEKITNIDLINNTAIIDEIKKNNFMNKMNQILFTNEYIDLMIDFTLNCDFFHIDEIFNKDFCTKNYNYDIYPLKREVSDIINSNIKTDINNYRNYFINQNLKENKNTISTFELFKFMSTYFFNILIRLNIRFTFIPFAMDILKSLLNSNIDSCIWLINNFSNQKIIEELLIKNPLHDMKLFILGLLYCAMIQLKRNNKKDIINNFIKLNMYLISQKFILYKECDLSVIYLLLVRFISLGDDSYEFLLENNIINFLISFYEEKYSQNNKEAKLENPLNSYKIKYEEFPDSKDELISTYDNSEKNKLVLKLRGKENTANLIVLICKIILKKNEYFNIFKENPNFLLNILLESNDRICVAHLKYIFKKNKNDQELIKIVKESVLTVFLNILSNTEDDEVNYLIYFYDFLLFILPFEENNNTLFILIKKYINMIHENNQFYLLTYFHIKNLIYLFKQYFSNNSDLIGKFEDDFNILIKWLEINSFPPKYYPSSTTQLYKYKKINYKNIEQLNQFHYNIFIVNCQNKTKEIKDNLKKIISGKFNEIIDDEDLLIYTNEKDYTNFKFSENDLIKYNGKNYIIIKVLDEMILIQENEKDNKNTNESQIQKWIKTNSSIDLVELHKKVKE